MVRKGIFRHNVVVTGTNDVTKQVSKDAWNDDLSKTGMLGFAPTTSVITISAGILIPTDTWTVAEAQGSPTSDDLTNIDTTNTATEDILLLLGKTGDTITLKHAFGGVGQIFLLSGIDKILSVNVPVQLVRRGTDWYEFGSSGTTFPDSTFRIQDDVDNTKQLIFSLGGASSTFDTTFTFIHTADRAITFPDATTTLAGLSVANAWGDFAQTFKDDKLIINNPADTFAYTIVAGAIGASYNLTLPTITASDTFAVLNFAQTLTNKTLDNTTTLDIKDSLFTIQDEGDSSKKIVFQVSGVVGTQTLTAQNSSGTIAYLANTLDQFGAPAVDVTFNSKKITSLATPTSASDGATKGYVDGVANGLKWKAPVRVATTANGALATAYENGDTIDGVSLATGDRILIKDQTTGAENGIYTVNATGAPTRATDFDENSEVSQSAMFVQEGTVNADKGFVLTNNGAITLDTTALVFVQFTGTGSDTPWSVNHDFDVYYYDMQVQSAPASPATDNGRYYTKVIDANNDGFFVKIKKAGAFVEVQIA